ncbi:hypothetical protein EL26_17190 [Tumebacillus flagellatus]|uniref:Yip1 domain-containing protein n=1 Tax=Tumebacillus flagellatus TaxID=1157490 RepID=A0A074LQS8_9BACL|nr:hypothetical protein EL26_17190 [Tumebacillus flagellatus]
MLIRPHAILAHLLKNPSPEASSRLSFVVLVMMMIDTAIVVGQSPQLETYLGPESSWLKWGIALLLPPLEFLLQRFVYMLTARLGLLMFASDKMPRTLEERRAKTRLLRLAFPYIVYPMTFFSLISSPFLDIAWLQNWFFILGLVYYFLLSVYTLMNLYGVSSNVAFWGPLLVQFLIFLAIVIVLSLVLMILLLTGVMTISNGLPTF